MLRPRRSLLAALLVLSVPSAFAVTITVNTTTDDNADNSLCSLREAIGYINRDKPVAGYQGCKAADDDASTSDTITLPADSSPYQINNSEIRIERSMTLLGAGIAESVTTVKTGGASAGHRAFVISFHPTYLEPVQPPPVSSLMDAPELDPADAGKVGNNLTTNLTPPIIGALAAPAGVLTRVTLYGITADGTHLQVATTDVTVGNTDWSMTPLLAPGLYRLVYTVRAASEESEPENPSYSNQLDLAVYSAPDVEVTMQGMVIEGCSPSLLPSAAVNCASNVDGTYSETSANGLKYTNAISGTADNGGLIYTDATLTLNTVKLSGGYAAGKGGAVYADTNALLGVLTADIRGNGAVDGAAVYIKPNSLALSSSLLTENQASAGAVVSIELDTPAGTSTTPSYLHNLTLSGNTGTAISLSKDVVVNNSTIVNNSKGVEFNGKAGKVYNSILAGNPLTGTAQDCSGVAQAILAYDLVQASDGCQSVATATALQTIAGGSTGAGKVMVDTGSDCASQSEGLLCRLADNGGPTWTHLPRILPGTISYSASPFFNQGSPLLGDATSCQTSDQRNKSRPNYDCDIGAVELQENTSTILSGGVISYGQAYTQTLATDLGDEELLPAALCPVTAPAVGPVSQYTPTAKGCPWVEMAPGKGSIVFNTDGSYTYRPASNFHGFDRLTVHVMTTYSSLQASNAKKSRLVQVTIISEPASGIKSDSVGAAGVLLLGGLVLLGFCVRGRRG